MDNPVYIIVALVALVVVAALVYFLRRGEPQGELPADAKKDGEPKPLPREKPAGAEPPPKKVEPEKKGEKQEPGKVAAQVAAGEPATKTAKEALQEPEQRAPAGAAQPAEQTEKKRSSPEDIAAIKKGLANTRGGFIARLAKLFGGKKEINPELLTQMEEVLLQADVGVHTTQRILEALRGRLSRKELADEDRVWEALREEARAILGAAQGPVKLVNKPALLLFVGVNGVGKTTTIGKLGSSLSTEGKRVLFAAGDTFRAAAVAQLEGWGRRTKCPVVKGKDGTDPGAVMFDAVQKARADGFDIVIADTAGRMHTKTPLMEELKKVRRTVEKALSAKPDEVLLVLDATTGQNAVQQAKQFNEALDLSGIVLTKLDGTAKGGVILAICDELKIPVRYIGIGERVEDLREFDPAAFVEALFSRDSEESIAA